MTRVGGIDQIVGTLFAPTETYISADLSFRVPWPVRCQHSGLRIFYFHGVSLHAPLGSARLRTRKPASTGLNLANVVRTRMALQSLLALAMSGKELGIVTSSILIYIHLCGNKSK